MVDPYVICTKVMRDFRSSLKTPLRSKTSPIKLYRGSAIASLLDLKRGILFWRFTACVYEYVLLISQSQRDIKWSPCTVNWNHRPFMLVKKLRQKMKTKKRYLLPETVQVSGSIKFVQDEAVVIEVVCATHYTPSNNWWRSSHHIRLVVQGGRPILGSPSDPNIDRHPQAVFAVTPRGQARLATAPSRRGTEIMNQNYFILPLVGTYWVKSIEVIFYNP